MPANFLLMEVKVRLTEQIINDSLKLHYRYFGSSQKRRLLVIPVVLVAVSVYLIYTELQKPAVGNNFYFGILYIVFAIAYYFYMVHRLKNMGKTLLKNLGENINFDMEISNEAVITKLNNSSANSGWSSFNSAIISTNIVMLYQQNKSFTMFEKSFFSNKNDFTVFKNLVTNNIQHIIQHS